MFTGIIQAVGEIREIKSHGADARYVIATGGLAMADVAIGDSIACQGVCLTAIACGADFYAADVSAETLACTTLRDMVKGSAVNLEKSLTPTTRLGGHIVSGHVDGVGKVISRRQAGRSVHFVIEAPPPLVGYIAAKGSICMDGISLTVNAVTGNRFEVNIVPHTLQATTMDALQAGQAVNLEADVVARYIERLLFARQQPPQHH